jgi:hypothetical protein
MWDTSGMGAVRLTASFPKRLDDDAVLTIVRGRLVEWEAQFHDKLRWDSAEIVSRRATLDGTYEVEIRVPFGTEPFSFVRPQTPLTAPTFVAKAEVAIEGTSDTPTPYRLHSLLEQVGFRRTEPERYGLSADALEHMRKAIEALGDPAEVFAKLAAAPVVATCFRCGQTTPLEHEIGAKCAHDGCDGTFVRCPALTA